MVLERKQSRYVLTDGWVISKGSQKFRTKQLLAHNAKVYLAARNAQKANEAIAELKNETGKEAFFLQLDLADIPALRMSAQEFLSYVCYMYLSLQGSQDMRFQEGESTARPYQQRVSIVWSLIIYGG